MNQKRDYSDKNLTLDANEDDWAWRAKIRSNPQSHRIYRISVGVLGLIVVVVGVLAIPLPGPGWLIVFAGLGIWASEFEWAQRLLLFVKGKVKAWEVWLRRQNTAVQGLVALGTFLLVLAIFWVMLRVSGIPGFLPDWATDQLRKAPGLT